MELRHELSRYLPRVIFLLCAGCFLGFQLHQLLTFNPYWGYDGGAHVHILETFVAEGRFPTIAENYLAWHEPLYYLLLGVGGGVLGVSFWLSHALIVLVMDALVLGMFRRVGLGWGKALFGTIALLALPAFLEVSMFLTNEALNYVFVLAIMHVGLTLWQETSWSWKSTLLFGIMVGFGVVTKITALVAFGVVAILLLIKTVQTKNIKYLGTIIFALVCAVACYMPWYAVRNEGLSKVSINNYDMLPAREFAFDERVRFMTRFDVDIFSFPFWYSGGTGFWSMLYADTVSDYLGLFENQDRKNALPESARVLTTHNGNSVSAYRLPLAQWAMWLGIVPVGVGMLGVGCGVWGVLASRARVLPREDDSSTEGPPNFPLALPTLGFASAFLLALVYYAYRYPYYDQGVIKSIFIAPAFVLPLALGLRALEHAPRWVQVGVLGLWIAYIGVVLNLFFIRTL